MNFSLALPGEVRVRAGVDPVWAAATALGFGFAVLFLVCPLGVALDYPNHLARTYIEGWLAHSENLRAYYDVEARLIPDLAMDLVVPWLSHGIGIYPAGAVMVILAAVLAPLAGVALSKRLHGDDGAWLPLVGFLSVFSWPMEFGFVNFLISVGLALWAFLLWTMLSPSWKRGAIFVPIGVILLLSHALGFLFLGFLVLLWEVSAWRAGERGDARQFLTRLIGEGALAFGPGTALLAASLAVGVGEISPAPGGAIDLGARHVALASPFRFYADALSLSAMGAAFAFVVVGLYLGLRTRMIAFDARMVPVCIGVGAFVAHAPVYVFGIWGLHIRYGAALIVILAAAVRFSADRQFIRRSGAVFGAVLAMKLVAGAMNVAATNDALQDIRAGLQALPDGARILPVAEERDLNNVTLHGVNLAVIERDAYAPTLFTNTSPVAVRTRMRAHHRPQASPPTRAQFLEAADKPAPAPVNGEWSNAYYYCWPAVFTHVIHFRPEGGGEIGDPRLATIKRAPGFVLYAVAAGGDGAAERRCAPAHQAEFDARRR